jgi:hypothetical protein
MTLANMSGIGRIKKAGGLLIVYRFLQVSMKKSILHIHLMNGP